MHYDMGNISAPLTAFTNALNNFQSNWVSEENPLYPEEDFEEFISRMISAKKTKIERELDLK